MTSAIPLVDLSLWRNGSDADRAALAATVDQALIGSGFLMVSCGLASATPSGTSSPSTPPPRSVMPPLLAGAAGCRPARRPMATCSVWSCHPI